MPADQSAKQASGQVASRNPVSLPSKPSKPLSPAQPSSPSSPSVSPRPSNRPVFPVAVLVVVLLLFFGGLFVYRFVFKKTIFTPGKKEPAAQVSPVPSPILFTPVGDVVAISSKEGTFTLRLEGSKVEYKVKAKEVDIFESTAGAKVGFEKLVKGQTVQLTLNSAPVEKEVVVPVKITVFTAALPVPQVKVGSGR